MDFDDAKENIQPLAKGRNASILQASLKVESPQELLAQRKELEKEIRTYIGEDPLSVWYNYIEWIEQSFPSGGKESGLQEVLSKCLSNFESDEKYKQDRRMIRLFIKFIDSQKDPAEFYQQLFNAGIGSMVADFYIAWAYCYDLVGNHRKADEIFRRGIACRAQPLEELQEAHQHFGFTVAQRLIYKDDDDVKEETNRQLQERRLALTSLRGHRRKQMVGSIRTGSAVKNYMPGTIKSDAPSTSSQRSNVRVQVFKDENACPNNTLPKTTSEFTETATPDASISVVRSIIDAARNQENQKEAGPWNRAHFGKRGKLFGKKSTTNELGFEIHLDESAEDEENVKKPCLPPIPIAERDIKFDKPFIYPPNFCVCSLPIKGWHTPITTEENPDKNTLVQYSKCKLYPRPNVEFSPEELKAYNVMKKLSIENNFTKERETYWGCGPDYKIRLYPHFATQSRQQNLDAMDEMYVPDYRPQNLKCSFDEIYNKNEKVERSFEEILALKIKANETTINPTDMEETMCATSERQQRRKSFFPMRKSLAPSAVKALRKVSVMPECMEQNESQIKEHEEKSVVRDITKLTSSIKIFKDVNNETTPKIVINTKTENKPISPKTKISTAAVDEPLKSNETTMAENSAKPFEIYHDESVIVVTNNLPSSSKEPAQMEDNFKFKTPALPVTNPPPMSTSLTKSNKVHFEIFEDESHTDKRSPNNIPKLDFCYGSGGFFDPEETCSTQTFNIFIKAQSVSTPKNITKTQPQRLFGNVLKEVSSTTIPEQLKEQQQEEDEEQQQQQQFVAVSSINDQIASENSPASAAGYSPPRQQLSTILEISEHGTTQGTHTTGATTKSTLSSPEFETESQVQTTNSNTAPQSQATVVVEATRELSCENSTIKSPTENVEELMNSLLIQNKSNINRSKQNQQHMLVATPAAVRLQKKSQGGGLDFSIFEDNNENNDKLVGNFSRLAEKEDTAASSAFKTLAPIPFQDDKTETITKMLMAPIQSVQFAEDKTETISKMLLAPSQPIKFPEEKTETISKFMLAPSQPIVFEDDEIDCSAKKLNSKNTSAIPLQQDDPFQFFGETPPKAAKNLPTGKQIEKKGGLLTQIRAAADARTPLALESKRFCDKSTLDMLLTSPQPIKFPEEKTETISKFLLAPSQPIVFEDEINCSAKNLNSKETSTIPMQQDDYFQFFGETPPKTAKPLPTGTQIEKKGGLLTQIRTAADARTPLALESKRFCDKSTPDIQKPKSNQAALFDGESHAHTVATQKNKLTQKSTTNSRAILRDSFMPEFSLIEDSQQTTKQQTNILQTSKKISKSVLRDSFMPEFSLIENSQPLSQKQSPPAAIQTKLIKSQNNSCLPDFSIIENSQTQQQQNVNSIKSTNKSFLPDFSHVPETQTNNDSIIMQSQPLETRLLKQNSIKSSLQSSFLNSFTRSVSDQQLKDNASNQWKQDGINSKNLMDTYMKDFSEIHKPPPIPKDIKEMSMVQPSTNNSSLRFLNESLKQKSQISNKPVNTSIEFSTTLNNEAKLSFLEPTAAVKKTPAKENKLSAGGSNKSNDKYFELNCETEMFAANMSMIKNSTWLPNHGPTLIKMTTKQSSQIKEDSLHIKHEEKTPNTTASISNLAQVSKTSSDSIARPKLSFSEQCHNFSIDISSSELAAINAKKQRSETQSKTTSVVESPEQEEDDNCEMSIYYKKTPKTPKPLIHVWDDADAFKTPANNNRYMHNESDLNQTNQVIENICIDPNVNPFNTNLIQAFLEQVSFTSYIESLSNCMLVGCIQRLKQHCTISIKGVNFQVLKLIGEGSYGAVFCGKETNTGRMVAMKQEKPPNFWEYYICLEIAARIQIDDMLPAYMSIDHALIGNNSSIFISDFSQYGSLISVCNKIKKHTMKNVDEYVVMMLACELLELMDHLHAVNIIHADVKADNILLINKLTYPSTQRCLQLIDFGVSIDMQLFKPGQTFSFVHNDNTFKSPEMREKRPWTFQLDLFGLAGVFHVLLFGKYMDIEKKPSGIWMHKSHVPRYFNKSLWETIFKALLNIRDCSSMPNLQELRALLKEEIEEKEKYVARMVMEFNNALNN